MNLSEAKEKQLMEFLEMIADLVGTFPDIMNNYFDENGLKNEYKNEKYSELVIIDATLKNNLMKIGEIKGNMQKETEDERIKDFCLIVGNALENLLQECTDFSLLFYTLITDVLLCKAGMDEETLLQDVQNLIRKYDMFVKKIGPFKSELKTFWGCYYD